MDIITEAEIISLSRQFARWLVQEAEMSENFFLQRNGYVMRYILEHETAKENAQQLISRMCAAPLVIQYEEELHTDDRPFCADMRCECHKDSELWRAYIFEPWLDGILTMSAAAALFSGR